MPKWKVTEKGTRENLQSSQDEWHATDASQTRSRSAATFNCQDPTAPIMRETSKCFTKFQTHFSACTQNCYIHLQKEVKHSEYKWHVQGHTHSQLQSQQKSN